MKFFEVEKTWICQLGKAANKTMLQGYVDRNDKSPEEFVRLYVDVVKALIDTPAWGVSGVNKLINELTDSVRATINHARNGKSSAPARANKLLSIIDFYHNEEAIARYSGSYKLKPLLSIEELQSFLVVA
jgi:hypothetical protein